MFSGGLGGLSSLSNFSILESSSYSASSDVESSYSSSSSSSVNNEGNVSLDWSGNYVVDDSLGDDWSRLLLSGGLGGLSSLSSFFFLESSSLSLYTCWNSE